MYCSNCGRQLEDEARFCSKCGTPAAGKGLSRPREGIKIAGVCAGVARYFELDVTLVRLVWILITIFPPLPGLIAYLVCWIVMPKDPLPFQPPPKPAATSSQTVDA